MRLLIHNQLVCFRKGCANHYPLDIQATQVEATYKQQGEAAADDDDDDDDDDEDDEPNLDLVLHMLPNLNYPVLLGAANKLGLTGLPATLDVTSVIKKEGNEQLLTRLHQILLETHIQEGALVCGKCGRHYPIQQGIPNMRLNEDEVQ